MNAFIFILLLLGLHWQPSVMEIARVSQYSTNVCSGQDEFQTALTNITTEVRGIINKIPPCKEEFGWTKIMDIDMSRTNDDCPQGLTLYSEPFRLCGRSRSTTYEFCENSTIPIGGQSYNYVCGRIKGYHKSRTYAFYDRNDIEGTYLDGVSLTYGPPGSRQHIWSFTAGYEANKAEIRDCPAPGDTLPPFVTTDYFCDTGLVTGAEPDANGVYVNKPLWDGIEGGCEGDPFAPQRCYVNNPPWFYKILPEATTHDIEMRVCGYSSITYGDTLLQEIELYVK